MAVKTVSWNEWAKYVNERFVSIEKQNVGTHEVLTEIVQNQTKEIQNLRNRVYVLEKPLRKATMLKLVNEASEPHMSSWFARRSLSFSYAEFFEPAEKGEIVKIHRGHLTLYQKREV
jgi:hypothetical protein